MDAVRQGARDAPPTTDNHDLARPTRGARADRQREVRRILVAVLFLNVLVALAKIAFGYLSGSLAISADGFHSLLDGCANVVALIGLAVAARPPDPNHAYGHARYETLATLGISALMLLTLFGIVQESWSRLQSDHTAEVSALSFAVMLGTLVVNVGVTLWERRAARRLGSTLLAADARHTLTDIVASLAVIVSLALVALGLGRADALVALAIAGAIAWGAWSIVRDASLVLTDATIEQHDRIERAVRDVTGVEGTHNIRSRGGEGSVWVDLHIQVDPTLPVARAHEIASAVAERVESELGDPADVTVHVEPADEKHLRDARGYSPGSREK